jgi:two-component system OmpR family response regulator
MPEHKTMLKHGREATAVKKKIIFIVEDNKVYARSLQAFIHSCFPNLTDIRLFSIGETCLLDMNANPDVVIIDYFLNTTHEKADNGLSILNQIKAMQPPTPVIMLSSQQDTTVILAATQNFKCSYVQKDEDAFNKVEVLLNNLFNDNNLVLGGLIPEPVNISDN